MAIPGDVFIKAAADHREAVEQGCVPFGLHCGTGKKSATSYVATKNGISHSQAFRWLNTAKERGLIAELGGERDWQGRDAVAEFPVIPKATPTYEELKTRQKSNFTRLQANREASRLINVKLKIDGPYGIMPLGDPHLDNPGTDWPTLDRYVKIIKTTEGMFGTNIGDSTDNWVGRMARLYAESSVSRAEALILLEGFLNEVRWLFVDRGNHDVWSGADDLVGWFSRGMGVHYKWEGSRVQLTSPNGAHIVINSRHDFPGRSQFHPTHGPLKAATVDGHGDDIYTAGHIHHGGYMLRVGPTGKKSHILRLSSFKVYDGYKDQHGWLDGHLPAAVFIIDPNCPPETRVKFFDCPEFGADYLRFLRRPCFRVKAV